MSLSIFWVLLVIKCFKYIVISNTWAIFMQHFILDSPHHNSSDNLNNHICQNRILFIPRRYSPLLPAAIPGMIRAVDSHMGLSIICSYCSMAIWDHTQISYCLLLYIYLYYISISHYIPWIQMIQSHYTPFLLVDYGEKQAIKPHPPPVFTHIQY